MAKTAYIFPGQGSQYAGMGKGAFEGSPAARAVFEEADRVLGFDLSGLCFSGSEESLRLTENTQPAILTVSVAVLRILQERGFAPDFVAGHSLGEYSALVCAGALTLGDAVKIVRKRGRYMQEAVPAGEGGMAAILGMALDQLQQVCADAAQGEVVSPANINSPDQIVISGHQKAVERAADLAKQRGAKRAVMLVVSAPFHCALMQPAQDRLEADLQALHFNNPELPVVANIDATPKATGEGSRQALVRQVTGAVQWAKSMQALIALGVQTFIEVGPGKVLTGLMRQIDRSQTCLNAEDEASLQKVSNLFAAAAKE